MSIVKQIASEQYRSRVNKAAKRIGHMELPKKGWLNTIRQALGMSAAQLARRLGVTRSQVSKTEKAELTGGVTIKTMERMAEGMGCRFVYAVVPRGSVEDLLSKQARLKAERIVRKASEHAALEDQALSEDKIELETRRLHAEMLKDLPSDFWNDEV